MLQMLMRLHSVRQMIRLGCTWVVFFGGTGEGRQLVGQGGRQGAAVQTLAAAAIVPVHSIPAKVRLNQPAERLGWSSKEVHPFPTPGVLWTVMNRQLL